MGAALTMFSRQVTKLEYWCWTRRCTATLAGNLQKLLQWALLLSSHRVGVTKPKGSWWTLHGLPQHLCCILRDWCELQADCPGFHRSRSIRWSSNSYVLFTLH